MDSGGNQRRPTFGEYLGRWRLPWSGLVESDPVEPGIPPRFIPEEVVRAFVGSLLYVSYHAGTFEAERGDWDHLAEHMSRLSGLDDRLEHTSIPVQAVLELRALHARLGIELDRRRHPVRRPWWQRGRERTEDPSAIADIARRLRLVVWRLVLEGAIACPHCGQPNAVRGRMPPAEAPCAFCRRGLFEASGRR